MKARFLQLYLALGGVSYYFSLLDPSKSAAENIDMLFFSTNAEFKNEFRRLYTSLFKTPERYMDIIDNPRQGSFLEK